MNKLRSFDKAVAFIRSLGISVKLKGKVDGLLPKITIQDGGIICQPDCHVSDLLHEAGHLAIIPPQWRSKCGWDVEKTLHVMFKDLAAHNIDLDAPVYKAARQTGDYEATAWAFAAGMHLKIPPNQIILKSQYSTLKERKNGTASGVDVREQFIFACRNKKSSTGQFGISGLCHAGMCNHRSDTGDVYPKLTKWVQDAVMEEKAA